MATEIGPFCQRQHPNPARLKYGKRISSWGVVVMSFFSRKTIALAVLSAASGPSLAAIFDVNSPVDAVDTQLNGVCVTANNTCSLRAAIQEANAQPNSPHTIRLQQGTYVLSLQAPDDTGASGDLDINSNVTISPVDGLGLGANNVIIQLQAGASGGSDYRIFHVGANGSPYNVTIKGVSIKGGISSLGAGIYLQAGTLDLIDSEIDGNTANLGTSAMGGGIYSLGTLRIKNSTISNNKVENNLSGTGGGIYIGQSATSTQITNSTIANNSASGTQGAGIYNASPSVIIASSTIANNIANGGNANGVGIANIGTSLRIKNTILAQSRNSSSQTVSDCVGTIGSDGNNFVGTASGVCTIAQATGDQIGTSTTLTPNLGTLTNNGGTTQTIIPLAGSPVIDKGASTGCFAADGFTLLTTDQRGQARSVVGGVTQTAVCDIGATEYNPSGTGGTGVSTGPAAMSWSFPAYANSPMSGSLAGFNPDVAKTDTTTTTGLTFAQVSPQNPRVGVNADTGFFTYAPGGFTGTDSFRYSVRRNGSDQTATGDVSIIVQSGYAPGNVVPVFPQPAVLGQPAVTASVKSTNKLRMSLPYADPDQANAHFTLTLGTGTSLQTLKGNVSTVGIYQRSPFLEYTPFDNASGQDSFQVTVFDGGSPNTMSIAVNIGGATGGTPTLTAVSSAPGVNRALSGNPAASGSLAANVTNPPAQPVYEVSPTGVFGTWSTTLVSTTYGRVDLSNATPGNFTYTVTYSGGVPTNILTDVLYFRVRDVNSTIVSNPSTITINFGTTPTASAAALSNVGRTVSATATGNLAQNVSILPAQPVYEVSTTGSVGTWSTTVSTTYGRIDLSTASPGSYTYTVIYSGGVPAGIPTDVLYFRVRDNTSTVISNSSTLTINFVTSTGTPIAGAHNAYTVSRTGVYSSTLSQSVTSAPANAVYDVALNGTTNFQTSAAGSYGTLQIGLNGAYTYTVNSSLGSTGVPAGITQESFQYRVRDPNSTVIPTPASLTINFAGVSSSLPEALPPTGIRATPGQPTTISLTYMTSAKSHTAVFGTKYVITSLPGKGKIYDASTGAEITSTILELTSNQIRYLPNTGTTGTDMFSFKVREPVSAGSLTYLDSQTATVNIDLSGTATGTTLDEGGGGSMGPLALLALLGLYARRRIK